MDATFIPVWAIGFQMIRFPDGWGGVLAGASPEPAGDCSDVHYLFRMQVAGGAGGGGGGV